MLSLATKLISLGLTGLGTSGLGIYFAPKLLVSSDNSVDLIYDEGNSEKVEEKLSKLRFSEEQLKSKLESLIDKFKTTLDDTNKKKSEKYVELQKNIQTVSENELKLQKIYEEGQKILVKLQEAFARLHEWDIKRLGHEAVIHSYDYSNKSLQTLGSHIYSWGESLEKIVCALDNKNNCENSAKQWFNNVNTVLASSTGVSSSGGALKGKDLRKHSAKFEVLEKRLLRNRLS